MKIAINVSREFLGGITASNLSFIKHIYGQDIQTVAIELNARRVMKGPVIFRQLDPTLFDHNIINIHNYTLKEALDSSSSLKEVEAYFSEVINDVYLILKETKPDVFLISGTYYIPWILSIAAKKAGIPVVLWYSGILTKEVENYKEKDRKLFSAMELSIIKRAKKIIFPSKICKTAVEELFHKHLTAKTYVIPNAVNRDFLNDISVDFSVSRRIAAVGRYTYIKNFDAFFEVHKKLLQQKWYHEGFFVSNIEKGAMKKVPKTVTVLPPMDTLGIKKFYLSQGLIISPSHFETFGNVPMEAVCLGIPVLVSDTMGCAEILKKVGLSNMSISFKDTSLVAERIKELCGQSILPKQINALRKLLDPELVNEQVKSILQNAIR